MVYQEVQRPTTTSQRSLPVKYAKPRQEATSDDSGSVAKLPGLLLLH